MNESLLAYLMGPFVMVMLGVALWLASRYHANSPKRQNRWLDTHYVDLMHHRN